jgi:thiol-disulfide isomerase/thioredoxin
MKLNYFYWKSCGYCKEFQPIMSLIKSYLHDNEDISIHEYERSQQEFQDIATKYKIQYFPTLSYELNGNIHEIDIDYYKNKYHSNHNIAKAIYSKLMYSQSGGGNLNHQYKQKYLKYKQKYLELKDEL